MERSPAQLPWDSCLAINGSDLKAFDTCFLLMFNLATLLLTSQSHANASGLCQSDQWHCPMWQDAQPKSLNLPMDQGCSLFKSNWWPLHLYEAPFTAKASSCLQLLICRALDQQPADIVETLKESSFCWPSHTETPVGQQNTDANSFHSFNHLSVLPDPTFYRYIFTQHWAHHLLLSPLINFILHLTHFTGNKLTIPTFFEVA